MRAISCAFSSNKERNKVCFRYVEFKPQVCLMNFQVKMTDNGRKNMFRDKQRTNKRPQFLHLKVLTEREKLPLRCSWPS